MGALSNEHIKRPGRPRHAVLDTTSNTEVVPPVSTLVESLITATRLECLRYLSRREKLAGSHIHSVQ